MSIGSLWTQECYFSRHYLLMIWYGVTVDNKKFGELFCRARKNVEIGKQEILLSRFSRSEHRE